MNADHPVRPWFTCNSNPCTCAKPKSNIPERTASAWNWGGVDMTPGRYPLPEHAEADGRLNDPHMVMTEAVRRYRHEPEFAARVKQAVQYAVRGQSDGELDRVSATAGACAALHLVDLATELNR